MAKKQTRKKTTRKTVKQEDTSGNVGGMSTAELQAELARRERQAQALLRRRDRLKEQLAEIEAQIRDSGGPIALTAGGRRRNESNLADSLHALLQGKEMNVTAAAEAVLAAGYSTTATNFRTIVNQTLLRDKRFKKVSRGVYTSK